MSLAASWFEASSAAVCDVVSEIGIPACVMASNPQVATMRSELHVRMGRGCVVEMVVSSECGCRFYARLRVHEPEGTKGGGARFGGRSGQPISEIGEVETMDLDTNNKTKFPALSPHAR